MAPSEDQTQMFMATASLGYRFWRKGLWTVYISTIFFYFRRGGEKYLRWLPVVVGDEGPRDGYLQNDLGQMVPWYRCGGCFLVLTIFMASSETWQTEWEVEVCVEAQCHWGGQSTEDSTELSSPPLQPLLPQRVRLSKLFCLSLWWRCHLETDLVPHFLMLYLEIIAYLQGCGKNSTESLIQFPPSFPMVATWTTPLQLKKKKQQINMKQKCILLLTVFPPVILFV